MTEVDRQRDPPNLRNVRPGPSRCEGVSLLLWPLQRLFLVGHPRPAHERRPTATAPPYILDRSCAGRPNQNQSSLHTCAREFQQDPFLGGRMTLRVGSSVWNAVLPWRWLRQPSSARRVRT